MSFLHGDETSPVSTCPYCPSFSPRSSLWRDPLSSLELENRDEVSPSNLRFPRHLMWLRVCSKRNFGYLGFAAVIIFFKHMLETLNCDWYTGKIIAQDKSTQEAKTHLGFQIVPIHLTPRVWRKHRKKFKCGQEDFQRGEELTTHHLYLMVLIFLKLTNT